MKVEICCGSYEDGMYAFKANAERIELNSALFLGGLTPSIGSLELLKRNTDLEIICMVRCRPGGFIYTQLEYAQMVAELYELLEKGADGIAFGFLNPDNTINVERTEYFTSIIHSYGKIAVFHRAIDVCNDYNTAIETLISLKVNRILTSGQEDTAINGISKIKYAQENYGDKIEILAGSGIRGKNVKNFVMESGVTQVHTSCRNYKKDPSSIKGSVSFDYSDKKEFYEVVDYDQICELLEVVK